MLLMGCTEPGPKVCFEEDCFKIEVVDTFETRQKGLMFRESLPTNEGMLFIFDYIGNYPFWMKNTLIPLDMIWMDWEGNIVYIEHEAQPCEEDPCPNYDPKKDAIYVLEVGGGVTELYDIKVGDQGIIDLRES